MLSKKDIEKIKQIVKEAVTEALTVSMTLEKVRDEKTNLPLAVPEIIKEDVYLPSWIAQYINFTEAALRGMQETTDKLSDNVNSSRAEMKTIAGVIEATENSLKTIAHLSDSIKALEQFSYDMASLPIARQPNIKLIEKE